MAESIRITLVALFFFRICVGGSSADGMSFETLLRNWKSYFIVRFFIFVCPTIQKAHSDFTEVLIKAFTAALICSEHYWFESLRGEREAIPLSSGCANRKVVAVHHKY